MAGKVEFRVTVVGAVETVARLDRLAPRALAVVGPAAYTRAQKIMTVAKDERVPVDLGTLKGSGYVEQPVQQGQSISVTMGFGGAAKEYARKQHEDMSLHHPGQGGPKYLSGPAEEQTKDFEDDVAKAVAEAIASEGI